LRWNNHAAVAIADLEAALEVLANPYKPMEFYQRDAIARLRSVAINSRWEGGSK